MNKREILKEYSKSYLGLPYIWGGFNRIGFDCSGLVQDILQAVGLDPIGDQTADALYEHYKSKLTSSKEIGNLVFWPQEGRKTHVAMIFDNDTIIEAGGGDSTTTSVEIALKQNACTRLRPLNYRGKSYVILDVIG